MANRRDPRRRYQCGRAPPSGVAGGGLHPLEEHGRDLLGLLAALSRRGESTQHPAALPPGLPLGRLPVRVEVAELLEAPRLQREPHPRDRHLAEQLEEALVQGRRGPLVQSVHAAPPLVAGADQEDVVEDELVGAHRKRLAGDGAVDELVEGVEVTIVLEGADRGPAALGDEAVRAHLPVEVPQPFAVRVAGQVIGDEVVVGDRVGREVAQVSEDERALRGRPRELPHRLDDRPAVTVVVVPPPALEVDDVRRDVPVEERGALPAQQGGSSAREVAAAVPVDPVRELEVVAGSPRHEEDGEGGEEGGAQEEGHRKGDPEAVRGVRIRALHSRSALHPVVP